MQLSVAADGMCIGKARSCLLTTRMPCDADNDQREQMDGMASLAGGRGGQSEPYMPSGVRSSGTAVLARTPRVAHTEDACSISFASAQHFRFDVESRPSNAGSRCRSLGTRCHDRARDFLTLGSLDSLQPERSNRSPSSNESARAHS